VRSRRAEFARWRSALLIGGVGIGLAYLGLIRLPLGALLVWLGLDFLIVSAGYLRLGPALLGKRADGSVTAASLALLAPYRLLNEGVWQLQRWLSRQPPAHEIAPGLWLGRRPRPVELSREVTLVVDLAAEFPCVPSRYGRREYHSLPCLDTAAPELDAFCAAVRRIVIHDGATYVHCALGHGRSATLVAAVLLELGLATDPDDAVNRIRLLRPGVALSPAQRVLLHQFWERSRQTRAAGDPP
jgi:protein-tyrosine phosphatase